MREGLAGVQQSSRIFIVWRGHISLISGQNVNFVPGGPKNWHTFLYALTSSNIDIFSNLFHCLNQKNICNNTIAKDPTTPQMCRYTTFWNVSVLKATIGRKDDLYNI